MNYFKLLLLISFISIVLIAGCTSQNKPFLKDVMLSQNVIKAGENATLNYTVSNPLPITFQGKVTYDYDFFCMNLSSGNYVNQPIPLNILTYLLSTKVN